MAYFRQQIDIGRSEVFVWDALRDVGALHARLVRGFVLECELDGRVRKLKFANGLSAVEWIIDVTCCPTQWHRPSPRWFPPASPR